jgi:signal transduction histidine kinase
MRPIPRFIRSSSFRLTLVYTAITVTGFLLLFADVYWSTSSFLSGQIDSSVRDQLAQLAAEAGSGSIGQWRKAVAAHSGKSPASFYLLQDAEGQLLAGNLSAMPVFIGIREWTLAAGTEAKPIPIRGRGEHVAGGAYLLIGVDASQLEKVKSIMIQAFLGASAVFVALGIVVGGLLSFGILRRIEAVSQTSREIIGGDLKRRMPLSGSDDEFDHLAASLNTMLDRIQTLMEGLRQVSSDIAHDLRTPLARLRQRLERAAQRAAGADELRQAMTEALRDVDTLLQTFSALLRIAQIESGARRSAFATVELGAVLEAVVELYQPLADERGQTLTLEVKTLPRIAGDRELLTQLFANLVDNAIRYAPVGGRVRVAASATRQDIFASVADNGPGIPQAYKTKVLQRFFRLESSRTTSGSGLGLSLVAAVAGLHGAELQLQDALPGLRVELRFSTFRPK